MMCSIKRSQEMCKGIDIFYYNEMTKKSCMKQVLVQGYYVMFLTHIMVLYKPNNLCREKLFGSVLKVKSS